MCTVLLPPGGYPIAVNKYIISHSVTHTHTHTYTQWDSFKRGIGSSQRPLPDNTQDSQDTDVHALGGIRNYNPSKRAVADPRVILHGHLDRLFIFIKHNFYGQTLQIVPFCSNYSAPKPKLDIGRILIPTYWKTMTSFPFFACDFSVSCISSLLLVPNIFPFF
jgi:hypothetical protein